MSITKDIKQNLVKDLKVILEHSRGLRSNILIDTPAILKNTMCSGRKSKLNAKNLARVLSALAMATSQLKYSVDYLESKIGVSRLNAEAQKSFSELSKKITDKEVGVTPSPRDLKDSTLNAVSIIKMVGFLAVALQYNVPINKRSELFDLGTLLRIVSYDVMRIASSLANANSSDWYATSKTNFKFSRAHDYFYDLAKKGNIPVYFQEYFKFFPIAPKIKKDVKNKVKSMAENPAEPIVSAKKVKIETTVLTSDMILDKVSDINIGFEADSMVLKFNFKKQVFEVIKKFDLDFLSRYPLIAEKPLAAGTPVVWSKAISIPEDMTSKQVIEAKSDIIVKAIKDEYKAVVEKEISKYGDIVSSLKNSEKNKLIELVATFKVLSKDPKVKFLISEL